MWSVALRHAPVAVPVPVNDFDQRAPPFGEQERRTAERVEPRPGVGDLGEPVEGLAHVAGFECDVDFEVAVEGEHGGIRRGL